MQRRALIYAPPKERRQGMVHAPRIDARYAPTIASDKSRLTEWRKASALLRESVAKCGEAEAANSNGNADATAVWEVSALAAYV